MLNQEFVINRTNEANYTANSYSSKAIKTADCGQALVGAMLKQKDWSWGLQLLNRAWIVHSLVIVNSYLNISIFSDSSLIKFNVYSQISYKILNTN